jgi:hypothetical protein
MKAITTLEIIVAIIAIIATCYVATRAIAEAL